MDTTKFFADARAILGGSLKQKQVDTLNAIIADGDKRGISNEWLAYILATAQGESAMDYSKRENMNYSAKRIGQVFRRLRGRENELAGNPTKLANAAYADMLGNGNEASGDGWRFRSAGPSGLTGKDNYRKFGLHADPDSAARLPNAVNVLYDGMIAGMFTGKKLADYDVPGGYDFHQARQIINGTFEAGKYAAWAQRWLDALDAAGRAVGVRAVDAPAHAPVRQVAGFWSWLAGFLGGKS